MTYANASILAQQSCQNHPVRTICGSGWVFGNGRQPARSDSYPPATAGGSDRSYPASRSYPPTLTGMSVPAQFSCVR